MTHRRPSPDKLNTPAEQARKDEDLRAFRAGKGSYRYISGQGFVFVPKVKQS